VGRRSADSARSLARPVLAPTSIEVGEARVQGTLVEVAGSDVECAEEAAKQTGTQVAKVQLEATGVELD